MLLLLFSSFFLSFLWFSPPLLYIPCLGDENVIRSSRVTFAKACFQYYIIKCLENYVLKSAGHNWSDNLISLIFESKTWWWSEKWVQVHYLLKFVKIPLAIKKKKITTTNFLTFLLFSLSLFLSLYSLHLSFTYLLVFPFPLLSPILSFSFSVSSLT